ncbi:MAG TPA: transporter [Candidatus Binatia bacterium]|nr:transporter [Candidatus Binatia bacterium]
MRARFIPLLLLALVGGAVSGWTQDMEPRAYSKTPIGMNFAVAGYAYSEGGLATDPAIPLEDAHLEIHTAFTAYVRSFGLLGRSCKADVVVPYAWVSGDAIFAGQPRSRKVEGFADPRFRFAMMFIGAPAMTLKESREYRGNFVMGGSVQVAAPLGQYDKGRLVNIGGNRWWVKPELGASRSLGKFDAELAFATTIFTDNDDFLGQTREQDPIYSGQAHLVYSLRPGLWLAVDGVYYTGGRTRVNGIRGNDLQENTRVGLTLAIPVNKNNSLKFYAGTGVVTRTGTDFDTIGIAWQTRWGGGL